MPYEPKPVNVGSLDGLARVLEEELREVAATRTQHDFFEMTVLHAEPEKLFQGLVAYADGTNWDPGDGEGIYRYDGTGWQYVG